MRILCRCIRRAAVAANAAFGGTDEVSQLAAKRVAGELFINPGTCRGVGVALPEEDVEGFLKSRHMIAQALATKTDEIE